MHRFTEFKPPIWREPTDPEPSLFEILIEYYTDTGLGDPPTLAQKYLTAWREMEEQAGGAGKWADARDVLRQLDALATVWGNEGVFRRCRDRLRQLLQPQQP